MNKPVFFDAVRVFTGSSLKQSQVDGFTAILDRWAELELTDQRWLAYMLATTWHETARTMQPIREYGKGKGREYGKSDAVTGQIYYGRGFVQLTWKANYIKMSRKLYGDDRLVENPDLALELGTATDILFRGMIDGDFTGVKLATYFNETKSDEVQARKIINGLDRAAMIAGYYKTFMQSFEI